MKKRLKVLENIKGSQTKVPQRGNRENAIKHSNLIKFKSIKQ